MFCLDSFLTAGHISLELSHESNSGNNRPGSQQLCLLSLLALQNIRQDSPGQKRGNRNIDSGNITKWSDVGVVSRVINRKLFSDTYFTLSEVAV